MQVFKGWFTQGMVTNVASAIVILVGGVVVTFLVQRASVWAVPIVYGLGTSAILSVIVTCVRSGLFKSPRTRVTPDNAKSVVREWLDNANVTVQSCPITGWLFNYVATIDGSKISIGQDGKSLAYLSVSSIITFTAEDNQALESTQGGISAVLKALRIALAVSKIVYSGIEVPLKQIQISKRPFIGDGLLVHGLHEAILEVECGLHIVFAIAAIPSKAPKPRNMMLWCGSSLYTLLPNKAFIANMNYSYCRWVNHHAITSNVGDLLELV